MIGLDHVTEIFRLRRDALAARKAGSLFLATPDGAAVFASLQDSCGRNDYPGFSIHSCRSGPVPEPWSPFLAVVRERLDGCSGKELERALRRARVYRKHRKALQAWIEGKPFEQVEPPFVDELDNDSDEMARSLLSLLVLVAESEPLILCIDRLEEIESAAASCLLRFLAEPPAGRILLVAAFTPEVLAARHEAAVAALHARVARGAVVVPARQSALEPTAAPAATPLEMLAGAREARNLAAYRLSLELARDARDLLVEEQDPCFLAEALLLLGDGCLALKELDEALFHYRLLLRHLQSADDQHALAIVNARISRVEMLRGNVDEALRAAGLAEQAATRSGSTTARLVARIALFEADNRIGFMDDFPSFYRTVYLPLLDQLREAGWENTLAALLTNGICLYTIVHSHELGAACALGHCREGITIAARLGNRYRKSLAFQTLAMLHQECAAWVEAGRYYRRAEKLIMARGDRLEIARFLNGFGYFHFSIGAFAAAFRCFRRALALAVRGARFYDQACAALFNIAKLHIFTGIPERAIPCLERMVTVMDLLGIENFPYHPRVNVYSLLGIAHAACGRTAEAIEFASRVESLVDFRRNPDNFPFHEMLQAGIERRRARPIAAEARYRRAIELRVMENTLYELYSRIEFAVFLVELGQVDRGRDMFIEAAALVGDREIHGWHRAAIESLSAGQGFPSPPAFGEVGIDADTVIEFARQEKTVNQLHRSVKEINFLGALQDLIIRHGRRERLVRALLELLGNSFVIWSSWFLVREGEGWRVEFAGDGSTDGDILTWLASCGVDPAHQAFIAPDSGIGFRGNTGGALVVSPLATAGPGGNRRIAGSLVCLVDERDGAFGRAEMATLNLAAKQLSVALGLIEVNEAMRRQAAELREQLELGKIAQLSIMPERPPTVPAARLHALYRPVDALGGDFYDYFAAPEETDRCAIFLCDVTGHGVSAALFTVMLKALLGTAGDRIWDGLALLPYLNGKMLEMVRHHLATACHVVIDSRQGTIRFTSAGHCKPLLVRKGLVSEIPVGGPILAARPDPVFKPVQLEILAGDRILLYTDGLSEEVDAHGTQFEEAAFHRLLAGAVDKAAPELLEELFTAVTAHAAPRPLQDDICMIAIDIPDPASAP